MMRVAVCALPVFLALTFTVTKAAEPVNAVREIPLPGTIADEWSFPRRHRAPQEIETIVRKWHQAKLKVERFDADFESAYRNDTFEFTELTQGTLAIDSRGRGFFESYPSEVAKDAIHSGYPAKPGERTRWHWTGDAVYKIDDRSRYFEVISLPEEDSGPKPKRRRDVSPFPDRPPPPPLPADAKSRRGRVELVSAGRGQDSPPTKSQSQPIVAGTWFNWQFVIPHPLPRVIVVGTTLRELVSRFDIKLLGQSETDIRLELIPLEEEDRVNYSKIYLLLDSNSYQLKAMKCFDSSGTRTQLFVFKKVVINERQSVHFRDLGASPNLAGYRRLLEPSVK